jgi:hypothetical protein
MEELKRLTATWTRFLFANTRTGFGSFSGRSTPNSKSPLAICSAFMSLNGANCWSESQAIPDRPIYRKRVYSTRREVHEAAMVRDLAMTEQAGEHCQHQLRDGLVDILREQLVNTRQAR